MKNIWFSVLFFLSLSAWAGQGIVQSSDGKQFEGEIRFENDSIVVSDTNNTNTRIELAHLSLLRFQAPPPADSAASATGMVRGLRASYFSNPNLTGNREWRIDPAVDFEWQSQAPIAGIPPGPFSVRWEGQIKAPASGLFNFYARTDGGIRLWIHNQLLIDRWQEQNLAESNAAIHLQEGQQTEIKLEFVAHNRAALVKLSWSGPSVPRSIVGGEYLSTNRWPMRPAILTTARAKPAGIVLTSGSLIARRISSADETAVRFMDSTDGPAISIVNVARILVQPLPAELEQRIPPGRTGLILSSKEFVEGEFKGFSEGQIRISSVLFGIKSYDPGQVIAVILRDPKPAPTQYALKTRDESLLLVNAMRIEKDAIIIQDAALAGVRIACSDLVEISRRRE